MAKSEGVRGKFQRLMPITDKNIGRAWVKWRSKRLYRGFATTEPVQTITRQRLRRRVIEGRKGQGFPIESGFKVTWAKTGAPKRLGGPTPARLVRPKHHRWLAK
jgi:hypothetical protein